MTLPLSRRSHVPPRWILWLFWLVTRKPHFRPLWKADLVSNDLLGQAEFLHEAGYQIAACMLARAFVERSVKRLALILPSWKEHRRNSTKYTIEYLCKHRAIDVKTARLIESVYSRASRVCHCGGAGHSRTLALLTETQVIRRRLEQATIGALGRAE